MIKDLNTGGLKRMSGNFCIVQDVEDARCRIPEIGVSPSLAKLATNEDNFYGERTIIRA